MCFVGSWNKFIMRIFCVYLFAFVCVLFFCSKNDWFSDVLIMQMTVYTNGVSVLMPGDDIPTFIAHPAPVPCPPQRISSQSQHQHSSSSDSSNSNSIQECWMTVYLISYHHHHWLIKTFQATNHIELSWVWHLMFFFSPDDSATFIGFGSYLCVFYVQSIRIETGFSLV